MNNIQTFQPDSYFHVYSKAVSKNLLFRQHKDYRNFLLKTEKYLYDDFDFMAYNLMPNHFHFLLRTREDCTATIDMENPATASFHDRISKKISNLLNSYAKSYNIKYSRKGNLFLRPFKRIHLEDGASILNVLHYIHRNPLHHELVADLKAWRYSSYFDIVQDHDTIINKELLWEWFKDKDSFVQSHKELIEDWNSSEIT